MVGYGFFVLAAVICQVTSQYLPFQTQLTATQVCSQPTQTCSQPIQVCSQPTSLPVATTIVDNSVAISLANALQLLVVSDLIESTLNKERVVVETPVCDLTPSVVEYAQFGPVVTQGASQVVEYAQFSPVVSQGPAQVVEYAQFGPVALQGPSQVVEYAQFSPVALQGQSQVVEYAQFSPVALQRPSQVVEYAQFSPVALQRPSQVVEYAQFSPVVEYAPQVVEYVQSPCGPLAAEVVFPNSIPAQLTCSLNYQSGAPVVNVLGVEAFAPTNCGVPGYYY